MDAFAQIGSCSASERNALAAEAVANVIYCTKHIAKLCCVCLLQQAHLAFIAAQRPCVNTDQPDRRFRVPCRMEERKNTVLYFVVQLGRVIERLRACNCLKLVVAELQLNGACV